MFFFENLFNNIALSLSLMGSDHHNNASQPSKQQPDPSAEKDSTDVTWIFDIFMKFAGFSHITEIPDNIQLEIADAISAMADEYDVSPNNSNFTESDIYVISALILSGIKNPIEIYKIGSIVKQYTSFESLSLEHPEITREQYNAAVNAFAMVKEWETKNPDKCQAKVSADILKNDSSDEESDINNGVVTDEETKTLKPFMDQNAITDKKIDTFNETLIDLYGNCDESGNSNTDESDLYIIAIAVIMGFDNPKEVLETVKICAKYDSLESLAMDHPEITVKQYTTANKIMQMYHEIQEVNQDKN